jgi:hypothetical protein
MELRSAPKAYKSFKTHCIKENLFWYHMTNLWGCITQPCPNKIIFGFSNKSWKGLQQIVFIFLEKFIYQKLKNVPKKKSIWKGKWHLICIGMVNRKLWIVFTCCIHNHCRRMRIFLPLQSQKHKVVDGKVCCNRVIHKVTLSSPCLWACFHSPIHSFSGICKVRNFIKSQYEMLKLSI